MLQLHTPIPVDTPKGSGFAHFIIDYGQEHNLLFVCFLNDNGECWTFPAKDIRLEKNLTMGIRGKMTATAAASEKADAWRGNGAATYEPGVAAMAGS